MLITIKYVYGGPNTVDNHLLFILEHFHEFCICNQYQHIF